MLWNMFYSTRTAGVPVITGDVYAIQEIDFLLEPDKYLDISLDFNVVELSVDIEIEQI